MGLALAASPALAQAQEGKAPRAEGPARREGGPEGAARPPKLGEGRILADLLDRLVKELNLTDEQQSQIRQMIDTHRQEVQNWWKQRGEDAKALKDRFQKAREGNDESALKELHQKRLAVEKDLAALRQKLLEQIKGVLTDEQKETFRRLAPLGRKLVDAGQRIRAALAKLDLTPEQKEKLHKLLAEVKEKAQAAEPSQRRQMFLQAMETVRRDILTDAQREELNKLREAWGQGHPGEGRKGEGKSQPKAD
jgi:Spy/CpxP family protein refolding chaperone